jgi:hypothetical protein
MAIKFWIFCSIILLLTASLKGNDEDDDFEDGMINDDLKNSEEPKQVILNKHIS